MTEVKNNEVLTIEATKGEDVEAEALLAEAEAEAAAKKATRAKMDATRSTRDGLKTDVTRIANDLLEAIKNGDAERIKAVSAILNRVSKAVHKEVLALDKISES